MFQLDLPEKRVPAKSLSDYNSIFLINIATIVFVQCAISG